MPYFATRQSKVGFPIFSGEDLAGRIMSCDHFFRLDLTPEESKVRLAVINFEGRALQWFQNWSKYQDQALAIPWVLFLQALEGRFGDRLLGDPMTELLSLEQTGSFSDYHDKFELLLGRVSIPESYAISHFVNGLRPYVQKVVRLFMPQTLVHAYALARLQDMSNVREGYSHNPRKFGGNEFKMATNGPNTSPLLPTPIVPNFKSKRLLTEEEMAERRDKGLCYGCNEKLERGHRCARKILYLLEVDDGFNRDESPDDVEENYEEIEEQDNPLISIHAINGTAPNGFRTMRVTGRVGKRAVNILIDSGSTHNFLDLHLAKKLGLQLTSVRPVMVDVADGNRLECDSMCKSLKWVLRNTTFTTDVLLLPLGNCDMILGVQWLETIGAIHWDFKNLIMEFKLMGKRFVLRGGQNHSKIQSISEKEMNKIITNCPGAQLCCIRVTEDVAPEFLSQENNETDQLVYGDIKEFLESQEKVFAEPTSLPPMRTHNHQIVLINGASPVNGRTYRPTTLQKNFIEQMVVDLLKQEFIQLSCSPFSSPVVLVKKKDGTWRMCIDYRRLNKIIVKDKYPIPLIEELMEELHRAAIFSKIDLRAGYHQIRMRTEDIQKTTFKTHDEHYEFTIMPFGLTNAPATFQSLMNDIFRPYLRKFVLVLFDDILVYSVDATSHLNHLRLVFDKLSEHSLFAKRSKCDFAKEHVGYLGHIISKAGVATDPQEASSYARVACAHRCH
ncbi:uncharacterized protein LOC121758578 [Salvia splendens]|uniref:uncharacterized protein LOC121758578 n=1 Tax=Salvia splendens TaxID=180675 RepID=UPI001C262C69|nr:uncharacterized protein LOC121758578 [Salvia splendens]